MRVIRSYREGRDFLWEGFPASTKSRLRSIFLIHINEPKEIERYGHVGRNGREMRFTSDV